MYPSDVQDFMDRGYLKIAASRLLDMYEKSSQWGTTGHRLDGERLASYLDRADRGEVPPLPTLDNHSSATIEHAMRLKAEYAAADAEESKLHPLQSPSAFREARYILGLSAQALADALHLGKGGGRTVRRWESGERSIPGPVAVVVGIWTDENCPEHLRPKA